MENAVNSWAFSCDDLLWVLMQFINQHTPIFDNEAPSKSLYITNEIKEERSKMGLTRPWALV